MLEGVKANDPVEIKNLMNSLERLKNRTSDMEDLSNLSWRSLNKFKDPFPNPSGKVGHDEAKDPDGPKPDLIDLFNEIDDDMRTLINQITANLNELNDIVG